MVYLLSNGLAHVPKPVLWPEEEKRAFGANHDVDSVICMPLSKRT